MFMTAVVLSINTRGLLVRDTATGQEVFVNFGNPNAFVPGDVIRVAYSGAMTQSIPPQISATSITRVSTAPAPQPMYNEIRRAMVLQIRRDVLIVRDPSQNNQQVTVNYAYAHHFCVGQRVNIWYESILLGEQGQRTVIATEVTPAC